VTPECWKQVEAIFEQALEMAEEKREDFLKRSCIGDIELRREVESLLNSYAQSGSFIDKRSLFFSDESTEEGDNLPANELIGPYRIVRVLGRGGMGTVYLAERADQQYQKRVAIKLIKRGMDTDAVLRHFRNERQILASFDHPNIARLFDGGTTKDGLPYFVMEYVEGVPIDQYCATHSLSVIERLKLFREACAAVSYAHRHTVIHRDIKMSNTLVTNEGTPKLLDFGIAKILQPGGGPEALMTITGVRPMTPEYTSPEQVRGEPVTTASDVYSLGIVLYELLVGRSPYRFTSRSPLDLAREITDTEAPRPSTVARGKDLKFDPTGIRNSKALKGDLDNIVLMALRKEPERRYQSVEQFSEDIFRHLENRPVLARKDTVSYRAIKFVCRNRLAMAAAMLVLVSLLAGLLATTWQAHRATVQKARAERRFNDVRQLAHSVLFDYHDAIKNLPGATHARERLVKDALRYLDSLAGESSGDPALQRELASAYERVGDVRGEVYGASIGDMTGALDSYQKALRIREALVAADPRDVNNRRGLADSYTKIGTQLQDTADAVRGLDYLRRACALYQQLATEQPDNSEIRDYLARAYNELGMALQNWGNPAEALKNHREALRLRRELLAADPRNDLHRRHLAITYWDIGQALMRSGDINAALEANRNCMELCLPLFAENPNNIKDRGRVAISYQMDGEYRALAGDAAGALESFRKKLQLDEQNLNDDPANAQARNDVAYSCSRIGELLAAKGDYLEALSQERKALEFFEKLSADSPQDLHMRYRTAIVGGLTAELYAQLGNREQAVAACGKALGLLTELPEDLADSVHSGLRGRAYLYLGIAQEALAGARELNASQQREHWRAARDLFQRSRAIWQDMQQRGILTADNMPKLNETVREIAKCDAMLADRSKFPAQRAGNLADPE
jgi:eukaryotic-like serine/threonine-protein kinase